MMKLRTSFLTRCLALAVALVLLVSSSNLGIALKAFAADSSETTVSVSALVASNYALTDAEKALLNSGLLACDSITYTAPTAEDGLVTVDIENATITAAGKDGWVPTTAYIVVGSDIKQTVTLNNGVGTYDSSVGNAFSVKVDYTLDVTVSADDQKGILNTISELKTGLDNLAVGYESSESIIGLVPDAMSALTMLANGIYQGYFSIKLGDEATAAVRKFEKQIKANGGVLDLALTNDGYEAAASKSQYLLENGAAYKATFVDTYEALLAITTDGVCNNSIVDSYMQQSDAAMYTKWMAFKKIMKTAVAAMEPVATTSWENVNASGLKSGMTSADYVALDVYIANLGTLTSVEVKDTLHVADTTIQVNLSMFDVTVKVVLNTVGVGNEIGEYGMKSTVLTLGEGISKDEVLAEIETSGIEAAALKEWEGVYADGKFDVTTSELSDTLTDNTEYVITYSPKTFTITYSYTTDAVTEVPYGYQLTLPVHADATQAYDYVVDGEKKSQGETVTITGDTAISRSAGKAYAVTDLYTVIADNYGNDVAQAILKSGALKNNEVISVRKPDPADASSLLKLEDGTLTASNYSAAYQGLNWAPYTYGETGTENAFSGSTASWTGDSAKVQYKLELTNYSVAEVQAILELAATLKAEAKEQKKTLDALAENYGVMGQLDKTKLGALNGVIDVTDFTPGDGTEEDAKNLELRAYFKEVVGAIIANNLDSNNYLKIYNMLGHYNTDGLRYYYTNSEAVINEVSSLSGYLDQLLDEEEALKIMVTAAGYPQYAEDISDLQASMAKIEAALTAPNAAIDLESDKLGALITALTAEGDVVTATAGHPYMISEVLTALDQSSVMVQIIIETPNGSATVTSEAMKKGTVWTAEMNSALAEKKNAEVSKLIGSDAAFYAETTENTVPAVGAEVSANINVYVTYTEKTYTVKIDGEQDQTVSISDLEIDLPKHPTTGWSYTYIVDGTETTASTYTFTKEQLIDLFENGSCTVTRVEHNEAEEKFEGAFADWIVRNDKGEIVGLTANVDGNADGLTGFAMTLVNSGYTYIGLNGEPLMYMNDENTLEVCLQTLVNAILADNSFGSQTLINLGNNGKGKLVAASLQLGNSASDIQYDDLDFVMNLTSVPAQMATLANGLSTIAPYMTFQSNNGIMQINIDLPEKVYEAYLAAMLATGNVSKDDITALNNDIALQFLWDYIDLILNTEATTTTYTNTLRMLGVESYDLTGSEKYYQMVKKALTNDGVVVNSAEDEIFDINISGKSKKAIDSLISALGIDVGSYQQYLGMIKEYKYDDATLAAGMVVDLADAGTAFEAAVVDVNAFKAEGIQNKAQGADFTNDLPTRMQSVTGQAAVILLDDVDGDLVFAGTSILDLNGHAVNGNITANGNLYIVDSSVDTYNSGWVSGSISGNVSIYGGNYNTDVSAYLKDGYYMDSTTVRNALYYMTDDGTTTTVVLNADVYSDEHVSGYIPNAQALAIDIACDLLLNHFTTAYLSVDGNNLVNINLDDLIDLIAGEETTNKLLNQVTGWITVGEAGYENNVGLEAIVNLILQDLLDVAALGEALENGTAIATYSYTTQPWNIELEHVVDGDYITVNVASKAALAKTGNIALVIESKYTDKVGAMLSDMGSVIVADETYAEVDIPAPTYSGNQFNIAANAQAALVVDMSGNEDYATIVGVILAYNNASNASKIVSAINNGNRTALEEAINDTTVQELISALKAMSRNVDFAAMCTKAGITADLSTAAELEGLYHLMLCGVGKAFETAGINGMNTKLSNWLEDGYYSLNKENISREVEATYGGYSALITLTADDIDFKIKLFGDEPDCLWGDVNHDNIVDEMDATLILQYVVGVLPENTYFCEKRADVSATDGIDEYDATLILQYVVDTITKFPAEG